MKMKRAKRRGAAAPVVFEASDDGLRDLRNSGGVWAEVDLVDKQLNALVGVRDPRRLAGPEERARRVARLQADRMCSRWVYYPWSGQLVHMLEPGLYAELRLARNRYKITAEEQRRLAGLTIGVVGLSVGNAVATTLALEGVGGHLKLADHDHLDTSNINRLRAPIHALGVNKAILASRQIAEFAPYLRVTPFTDGLTDDNLASFFEGLDLIVDECDDFRIKLLIREEARRRQIPVVMETSDRGLVDVERFDREPERLPFHGLLAGVRSQDLGEMGDGAKLEMLLRLMDPTQISARGCASLLETRETLEGWPQLASDVVLGGASACAAVRRILLGQPVPSGSRRVDLEAVLADDDTPGSLASPAPDRPNEALADLSSVPPDIQWIVSMGTRAPSGGNAQPWTLRWSAPHLDVIHDPTRDQGHLNVASLADHLGLGALMESLEIAATARGLQASVDLSAAPHAHVARLSLHDAPGPVDVHAAWLERRETNRHDGDGSPLTSSERDALSAQATRHGVGLSFVEGAGLHALADVLGASDRVRLLTPALHADLVSELRWTPEEVARTRDGIDIRSLGLDPAGLAALQLLARGDVVATMRELGLGGALQRLGRSAVTSASAAVLFTIPGLSREQGCRAGRALQRVWLEAARLGLGFQPIGTILFMHRMLGTPAGRVFRPEDREALERGMSRVEALFELGSAEEAVFLCRVHRPASDAGVRSLRRQLGAVLGTED